MLTPKPGVRNCIAVTCTLGLIAHSAACNLGRLCLLQAAAHRGATSTCPITHLFCHDLSCCDCLVMLRSRKCQYQYYLCAHALTIWFWRPQQHRGCRFHLPIIFLPDPLSCFGDARPWGLSHTRGAELSRRGCALVWGPTASQPTQLCSFGPGWRCAWLCWCLLVYVWPLAPLLSQRGLGLTTFNIMSPVGWEPICDDPMDNTTKDMSIDKSLPATAAAGNGARRSWWRCTQLCFHFSNAWVPGSRWKARPRALACGALLHSAKLWALTAAVLIAPHAAVRGMSRTCVLLVASWHSCPPAPPGAVHSIAVSCAAHLNGAYARQPHLLVGIRLLWPAFCLSGHCVSLPSCLPIPISEVCSTQLQRP